MNMQKENDVIMCNGQVRSEDDVFIIIAAYCSTVMECNQVTRKMVEQKDTVNQRIQHDGYREYIKSNFVLIIYNLSLITAQRKKHYYKIILLINCTRKLGHET